MLLFDACAFIVDMRAGAGTRIQMHSVCMQVHACTSSRMSSFEMRLRPCSRCVCIHFYRLGNGCRHRKKCCSMEDGSQCLSEYTLIEVWSNPIKRTGVLCLFIWFRKGFILLHIVQGRWCMWSCMLRAFPADSLFIIAPHHTAQQCVTVHCGTLQCTFIFTVHWVAIKNEWHHSAPMHTKYTLQLYTLAVQVYEPCLNHFSKRKKNCCNRLKWY